MQSNQGNVWLTSSRNYCPRITGKTISRTWINYKSKIVHGLWKHKTRPICFCLVVDDFAVKYIDHEDANHLINTIRKYYPMTVDKEAMKYIGLTIQWDYTNRKAHIYMLGYLNKAFVRFKHEKLMKIQNSPHPHDRRRN